MNDQKREGFTLIEIMVVVGIIGVLSTVGVVSYGKTRAKARDAKYIADAVVIQKAVDRYYSDHGNYPYNPSDPYNRNWWYANRQEGAPGSVREAVSAEYLPVIPKEITTRPTVSRLLYYWTNYSVPGLRPPTKYMVLFIPETEELRGKGTCTAPWASYYFCLGTGAY